LKKIWHSVTRLIVVAFVATWFFTVAHETAYHSDHGMCGHGDHGSHTECVCLCACHAAVEPSFTDFLYLPEVIPFIPFDYISLLGTDVPNDIFRPPLANS